MKKVSVIEAIGILLIRLLAAVIIFSSLFSLPVWLFMEGVERNVVIIPVVEHAVLLIVGLFLWYGAGKVVKFIVPNVDSKEVSLQFEISDVIAAGSFLIGLYYLIQFLPQALFHFVDFARAIAPLEGGQFTSTFSLRDLIIYWLAVSVALFLTVKPRELARLFTWLRFAGMPDLDKEQSK